MCPFKVLSRENGRLYSAVSSGDFRLEYTEGALTEAKRTFLMRGFGICCFETENDANRWRLEWPNLAKSELWECDAIWEMQLSRTQAFTRTHTLADFANMVKAVWPEGTMMYRAIRLTRRLL
jgi:hypothetical protein